MTHSFLDLQDMALAANEGRKPTKGLKLARPVPFERRELLAHCDALHQQYFGGKAELCKSPFIRKNVISYWGRVQKYKGGWQVKLAWQTMELPDWIRDYIIVHELAHCLDDTRQYRSVHTVSFWALLKRVYPHTARAERALNELTRRRGQGCEIPREWQERWATPNERRRQ